VGPESALRPGDFLGAEFPYDLQELLRGETVRAASDGGAYVVTRKSAADKIETIQLGRAARTFLERADGRRTARELIAEAFPESAAERDPQRTLDHGLGLLRSLAGMGLLLEGPAGVKALEGPAPANGTGTPPRPAPQALDAPVLVPRKKAEAR
jgi:hypothetical protein